MLPGVSNYFATSAALMEYMRSTEFHSGCLFFSITLPMLQSTKQIRRKSSCRLRWLPAVQRNRHNLAVLISVS